MSVQLISIGYGKETFATNSASLSAFVVEPEFVRNLPSKVFKRQGHCQRFPASQYPEINGSFYLDSVSVPEGTVIVLQSSHRVKSSSIRDGAIFIALRNDGAMLSISANLPSDKDSLVNGSFLTFQGRGDILNLDELAMFGIVPPKNYINGFLDPEQVEECYTITVMAPAQSSKPVFEKLKDREGNVVLAKQRPGRKISLRRLT